MAIGQLRKLGSAVMKGKPKKGGKGKAAGFTPAQRAYANETLGADAVKDMEMQGFTKEQILQRAKKLGGPQRNFKDRQIDRDPEAFEASERRAKDTAEGGMRSAGRPGLRMKKGGVATKKKKKKSNGLPNGIVPADKYFTKKAYAIGGAVTAIRNVAGTIASKLKKEKAKPKKAAGGARAKQMKKFNKAQDKFFREKSKTKKKG